MLKQPPPPFSRPHRFVGFTAALLMLISWAVIAAPTSPAVPPAAVAVPAFRQVATIGVITIRGEIVPMTLHSLERRIERARLDGCEAIVLDIDTPGGRVDVTLDICNMLKDRNSVPANVVAWVHPQAYSAGTIISLACREIVVTSNGTFGDVAPIKVAPGVGLIPMAPAERAKMEAPLLAEVIDSARRHHYDEKLVQAFISVGIELWMLENNSTGERIFVDRTEFARVFGDDPPESITSVTPKTRAGTVVLPHFDTTIPREATDGAGISPDETSSQIIYQQMLPTARPVLTDEDAGDWTLVSQVIAADRLLTVKAPEALHYGLATETIDSDEQLLRFFGASSIIRYDRTWSESLVRVLVTWPVRIVLIVIFLICALIEMFAPGTGIFGLVAAGALLILIGAPALAGLAQWWDVLLVGVGLLLIAAEIFVIPGFGVAGVSGVICLLAGLIGTFVSGDLSTSAGQSELWTGVASVFTALFTAGVCLWLISRQLHSIPLLQRLMLKTEITNTGGAMNVVAAMRPPADDLVEIGAEGVTHTDLRPSGRVMIDGHLHDAHAPGHYLDAGCAVRVTAVGRFELEVEEIRT